MPHVLALLLGAIAALGFAPLDLWPLTLGAFAGLFALVQRRDSIRGAALSGWLFGCGHFTVGLNWIATAFTFQAAMPAWLGWVAVVLLSLYLAFFPALAAAAAWSLAKDRTAALVPAFAATWIISELLRATLFTGFAWNPLGVIWLSAALPVARAATLIGTYGLSGLTVLAAGAVWLAARQRVRPALHAFLPVPAAYVAGTLVEAPAPAPSAPLLHIVQPNINQSDKWDEKAELANFARLARLTGAPGPTPRLILWPEVAIPWFIEQDVTARRALARLLGPKDTLLTGAQAIQYDGGEPVSATNSVFALTPAARLSGRYDKAHLVPYGEYLPMRPLLASLGLSRLTPGDMDFLPGPGPANLNLPGIGPIGVQICYEIIFSGHVVGRERPVALFNPSNDAWFGRWGPPQHLAQARLRAIEEGLPVLRSTPTGISAVIAADGRVLASIPWGEDGAIVTPLPAPAAPTPFARLGNIIPAVLALVLALTAFALRRRGAKA